MFKSVQSLILEMTWTIEQNVFTVEVYFRHKYIRKAQLQFKKQFRCLEFPNHAMIYRWVNNSELMVRSTT